MREPRRAGKAERGRRDTTPNFLKLLERVPETMHEQWRALRGPKLERFAQDWQRLQGQRQVYVDRNPIPHFGSHQDRLAVQSLAFDGLVKAVSAPGDRAEATRILGYLGSSVEAYGRCVEDGRRQLDLNYREAHSLEFRLASVPERLRDEEVKSCQAGVGRLEAMRAKLTELEGSVSQATQDRAAITVVRPAGRRRDLNDILCDPGL